ncbi:DUF2085 domain-containing protein [Promethearchaeum syntrophicum]|uniref:DUF2085 domain-containing protein n=1 Tax=Promethearchaeum syntrophicum TaxID=2594042 RepID=A0A5B9D8V1_9ARCH|nr:DUF2085 domain-containing protein [Candidatus Prometheoarchaeum syntrophicum]QEE15569.1 hypothetical protein DSAG12_01395 [Candidatus Prometheoarchaeum syntrophicum]
MPRSHNPDVPIIRTRFQTIIIWLLEFFITAMLYYFSTRDIKAFNYITIYSVNPAIVINSFPMHFWISILFIQILARLFKRSAVLLGALSIEFLIEYMKSTPIQPVLIGFIIWTSIFESFMSYKGGEYYSRQKILKQIGYNVLYIFLYLPIIYFGYVFTFSFTEELSESTARTFVAMNFLVNMLFLVIPLWVNFFILDRFLVPYFPLLEEEEKIISQNISKYSDDGEAYDDFIPKPGEFYSQLFTHHSLEEDDHTIIVLIGKVRFYLCTRCTAMILGILITIFLSSIALYEFNLPFSPKLALYLIIFLPIFPLTDWGLQAVLIRKATTISRLITGFILGISMQMIAFISDEYVVLEIIIVLSYFIIFGVLFYFRVKVRKKQYDKEALSEFIAENSNPV